MAFIQGPVSFYATRFLLGVAKAGCFPGIAYYVSQHPRREDGSQR